MLNKDIKTWFFSILSISSSILAVLVLLLTIYLFGDIAEKHDKSVKNKFENSIVTSIKLYDQLIREKTQLSINGKIKNRFSEVNAYISKGGISKNRELADFCRKNQINISFFDLETGSLIPLASDKNPRNVKVSNWNGYTSLIKQLNNNSEIASRIAWSSKKHIHRIFHMKISDNKEHLISIEDKDISFSVIDEFIKKIMVNSELSDKITNIKLFDSDGYPIHFEAAKVDPDGEIVKLLQTGKIETIAKIKHDSIEHLIPIDQGESEYYRNIRAVKITYSNFNLLTELQNHKLIVITIILIYFFLCGLLARFLSEILVSPIKKLEQEVEISEKTESRINYETFHLTEVRSLSLSFVKLVEKLKSQKKDIENLAKENIRIQEQERKRIAMDLHDSVGQTLSAINIRLSMISTDKNDEITKCRNLVRTASKEISFIYKNLFPNFLFEKGLETSLKECLEWFISEDLKKNIHFDIDHQFTDPQKIGIFRILQEACHNITKHSNATVCNFSLTNQGVNFLHLKIENNGIKKDGLNTEDLGYGLKNMKLRCEQIHGRMQQSLKDEWFTLDFYFPKTIT